MKVPRDVSGAEAAKALQRLGFVVILSRQDLSVGEQMRRLLRLISTLTAEEMRNRIEFLSGWGSDLRFLISAFQHVSFSAFDLLLSAFCFLNFCFDLIAFPRMPR